MPNDEILSLYGEKTIKFGGSADEKAELIRVVYSIMGSFVDRAFGVDAVQLALADKHQTRVECQPRPQRTLAYHRQSRSCTHRAKMRPKQRRVHAARQLSTRGEAKCRKKAS